MTRRMTGRELRLNPSIIGFKPSAFMHRSSAKSNHTIVPVYSAIWTLYLRRTKILEALPGLSMTKWQKLVVHPGIKWGNTDVGLWLNLMLPQRRKPNRGINQSETIFRKLIGFAYNNSQCKWATNCRYKYEFPFYTGAHPVSPYFKNSQSNQQSNDRESLLKSPDSGESSKNASMVRSVSRQNVS